MVNLILEVSVEIDPSDSVLFGHWLEEVLLTILTNEFVEDNVSVRFVGELYHE